ncbi:MAG: anthranilate phosphoribosyltransferase [Micavibrio aeruginosavorus]|uniref:Anthranilate phosphoribosyltransferase n=1 Tax=Micavibrio aeruginosavorus TaxID=349221 RepID=A0A2W5BMG1_9BACT|nr:MAG: anthranilate phosphoribosyltransferase [Micavibrio aeruginosavorus]
MTAFENYVSMAAQGHVFSGEEMSACIAALMQGDASADQAALFLTSLANRGETADEIAGAASALRTFAATITAPEGAIDCCGTGGDGSHTYNISTAVAFVAAACGVPMAKHGNRSASSKSGAADVLEKLGVNIDVPKEKLERALAKTNFCFLMAPAHHRAMRHVAEVRKSLGFRTIFNLLGPLANPAGTKKQLIGVFAPEWVTPVAEALNSLGTQKALVVHGEDGLDEISLSAPTRAAFVDNGTITNRTLHAADFGLAPIALNDIKGGNASENARALIALLNGEQNAYRSIVLANAAAVLHLHDGRPLKQGVASAAAAIDSSAALNVLNEYKEMTA